jgi:tripartite-type tricarboxylate transporter receptor subunit TctC
MVLSRRLLLAGALAAPTIIPSFARGQSILPDKTIRIFVGFEAGGGADTIAHAIATQLERRLSHRVTVENRPGQAAALPGEIVKNGPADGSQLAFLSSTTLVSRLTTKDFPFDPINDLAPITLVGTFPMAFAVSPKLGVETFADYLKWLKAGDAQRRKVGNTSSDAFIQVLNILLSRSIGEALVPTNYRGAVPLIADLEEGRIPAAVTTITSFLPAHRGGRLRILMSTGAKRLGVARDIPTAAELGFSNLEMQEWFAFFASAKTPMPVVAEWNRRLGAAISDASVVDQVRPLGLELHPSSSPDSITARIDSHQIEWEARMKEAGMKPTN